MSLFAPMALYAVLAIAVAVVSFAAAIVRERDTGKAPERRISLLLRLFVLAAAAWLHVIGYVAWQLVSSDEGASDIFNGVAHAAILGLMGWAFAPLVVVILMNEPTTPTPRIWPRPPRP